MSVRSWVIFGAAYFVSYTVMFTIGRLLAIAIGIA